MAIFNCDGRFVDSEFITNRGSGVPFAAVPNFRRLGVSISPRGGAAAFRSLFNEVSNMRFNHHATAAAVSGILPAQPLHPLGLQDSAVLALTDFQIVTPLVIEDSRSIEEALQSMIVNGVRALLAAHAGRITGFITSYDIQGERPIQFMDGSTYRRYEELQVNHIMTPWSQLSAVSLPELQNMSVAALLASMVEGGLTHLLVLESATHSVLRGIVSRTRMEKRLALGPEANPGRAASAGRGL